MLGESGECGQLRIVGDEVNDGLCSGASIPGWLKLPFCFAFLGQFSALKRFYVMDLHCILGYPDY